MQLAAQIDYEMVFCKSCLNIKGDSDGLSFVTAAETKKLSTAICEDSFNVDRTKLACKEADQLVYYYFTLQDTIISDKEV